MATTKKKTATGKAKASYVLTPITGDKPGKQVSTTSKETARTMYDFLVGTCDRVEVQKTLIRTVTRAELDAISRTRTEGTVAPASPKSR